jgi:hypothetical protein
MPGAAAGLSTGEGDVARSSVPASVRRQACAVAAGSLRFLKTFACNLRVYS